MYSINIDDGGHLVKAQVASLWIRVICYTTIRILSFARMRSYIML